MADWWIEAGKQCNKTLAENVPSGKYCHGGFNGIVCFPHTLPGNEAIVECPIREGIYINRYCELDGQWRTEIKNGKEVIWTEYNDCEHGAIEEIDIANGNIETMTVLMYVGYSFSLVALFLAMCVFIYFKRLHCTRNFIHLHLFASFFLRALMLFVKGAILKNESESYDINSLKTQITNASFDELLRDISTKNTSRSLVGCKVAITIYHYFVATNYFWIVVEGLYLHCLIFVAFFAEKKYLLRFTLTGWGLPLVFVIPWVIVKEMEPSEPSGRCWNEQKSVYRWIYDGPLIAANLVNFLLFVNILRVLWYKLRYSACNQPEIGNQYRKLAKSTLVLIPLFGVHAIFFRGMPDNVEKETLWHIRMYWELFFDSFQGFFVAIIYCFINGEVLAELKRAWRLFQTSFQIQRNQRQSTRSSNTIMTNFSSTATPLPPRPSIASSPFKNYNNSQSDEEDRVDDVSVKITLAVASRTNDQNKSIQESRLSNENIPGFEKEPLLLKPEVKTSSKRASKPSSERPKTPTEAVGSNMTGSSQKPLPNGGAGESLRSPSSVDDGQSNSRGNRRSSDDSGINSLVTSSMNRRSSNLENISCESIGDELKTDQISVVVQTRQSQNTGG